MAVVGTVVVAVVLARETVEGIETDSRGIGNSGRNRDSKGNSGGNINIDRKSATVEETKTKKEDEEGKGRMV